MTERLDKKVNIPGIVNGIPEFHFTIPVHTPQDFPKENLTNDLIVEHIRSIVSPIVETKFNSLDNEFSYSFTPNLVFGAGHFLVHVRVKKLPEREAGFDYYSAILRAVRDVGYISGLHDFATAKHFSIQGHSVPIPEPLPVTD